MNASELLGYEHIILFLFPFTVELSVWTSKNLSQYTCNTKRTVENELVRAVTMLRKGNTRILISVWDGKS